MDKNCLLAEYTVALIEKENLPLSVGQQSYPGYHIKITKPPRKGVPGEITLWFGQEDILYLAYRPDTMKCFCITRVKYYPGRIGEINTEMFKSKFNQGFVTLDQAHQIIDIIMSYLKSGTKR